MSAHRHHVSQHPQVKLAAHAHRMRVAPSEPERALWAKLRACQLGGVRFWRQVVVAGVIVLRNIEAAVERVRAALG